MIDEECKFRQIINLVVGGQTGQIRLNYNADGTLAPDLGPFDSPAGLRITENGFTREAEDGELRLIE